MFNIIDHCGHPIFEKFLDLLDFPGLKGRIKCIFNSQQILKRHTSPQSTRLYSTAPTWKGDLNLSKWGPNGV